MTSSAPYWGNIELPAAVIETKRRGSVRKSNPIDSGINMNPEKAPLADPRGNRQSVQSQAPTMSTTSPFASPVESNFRGEGLAPRPPSLPYNVSEPVNKEALDRRRRRAQRAAEIEREYSANPTLPAAPDAPREAPRPSFSNGNVPAEAQSSRKSVSREPSHPEDYYRDAPPNRQPSSARRREPLSVNTDVGGRGPTRNDSIKRGSIDARKPSIRTPAAGPGERRRSSNSQAEAQRRGSLTTERSPLQILEQRLDKITKQEKRALVEEAELQAREVAARRQSEQLERARPSAVQPPPAEPYQDFNHSPKAARGPAVPPKEDVTSGSKLRKPAPETRARGGSVGDSTRPASFRDRAAVPLAGALAGAATEGVQRSGSRRLSKDPPKEAWQALNEPAQQTSTKPAPGSTGAKTSGKANMAATAVPAQKTSHPLDQLYLYSDDTLNELPKRSTSTRKAEALLGADLGNNIKRSITPQQQQLYADRLDRSEELGPDWGPAAKNENVQSVKVGGRQVAVPAAAAAGNYGQDQAATGPDGHHYFSKIIHAGRDRHLAAFRPGDGLYAPGPRLSEWKQAKTASLTGDLLEIDINKYKQTEADKDKAWWEAGHTGKRRQSKAQTFDGPADATNGRKTYISSPLANDNSYTVSSNFQLRRRSQTVHMGLRERIYTGELEGTPLDQRREARKRRKSAEHLHRGQSLRRGLLKSSPSRLMRKISKRPSYSWDCPEPSKHNLFHPDHLCSQSILKNNRLTKTTRSLRVAQTIVPTQFKPHLYLKCGPLLRYTGIRKEKIQTRPGRPAKVNDIWRGSVMIVTDDAQSSYDKPPVLRLFVQPKELLPPPPAHFDGETDIPPEYVDPIAGHPKIGRDGRTLYVRPVEELPEAKDVSRDESDGGIFERHRSHKPTHPGGFDGPAIDGEKVGKAVQVQGIRLHAERGVTFWRFNIEVQLVSKQQRIAYRINGGPVTGFWVPAQGESMNIMFHSCNGFSQSVDPNNFSGPDPMWRDVLNTHQSQPFHVMIGGGDQIYNDCVMRETEIFQDWLTIKNPLHKHNAPFTKDLQDELESFYLNRYCMWFSQGLFSLANSQIPMVNMYDDHDIIDGFGSYPHHFMDSPVFSGLGNVAFKYYMLFQHQSSIDETEDTEPSWLLGVRPGPYIKELSRSIFVSLGGDMALLAVDCRTERTRDDVLTDHSYDKIMDRCKEKIIAGETRHLLVLLGVPIAYPRLVWLETLLTSRIMDPVKALSRAGAFKNLLNQFDGGVEILDDLDDHWTAKNHKAERKFLIQDLQDLAAEKSVRVTILSGDVHLAAVGQFYSAPRHNLPKDGDFRYMPNIISSAIANTPPPDVMADILNKRNKVHHLDEATDEDMIPLFTADVNGKPRNNKAMLPRRNWCQIRKYNPELSPPPTPEPEMEEGTPSPSKGVGGLLRGLSQRGPKFKAEAVGPGFERQDSVIRDSRPPVSGQNGGGLLRRLSLSRGRSSGSVDKGRQDPLRRTQSVDRAELRDESRGRGFGGGFGGLMRRFSMSRRRPSDNGGINGGGFVEDTEDEEYYESDPQRNARGARNGAPPADVNRPTGRRDLYEYNEPPPERSGGITGLLRSFSRRRKDDRYVDDRPYEDEYDDYTPEDERAPHQARQTHPQTRTQSQVRHQSEEPRLHLRGGGLDDSYFPPVHNGKGKQRAYSPSQDYSDNNSYDGAYSIDEERSPTNARPRGDTFGTRGPPQHDQLPARGTSKRHTSPARRAAPVHGAAAVTDIPGMTADPMSPSAAAPERDLRKTFHRTPTSLSQSGPKRGFSFRRTLTGGTLTSQSSSHPAPPHTINLEGGLEVILNMEVNQRDPAGITTPYRLLVPRLWWRFEERGWADEHLARRPSVLQRLSSVKVPTIGGFGRGGRKAGMPQVPRGQGGEERGDRGFEQGPDQRVVGGAGRGPGQQQGNVDARRPLDRGVSDEQSDDGWRSGR